MNITNITDYDNMTDDYNNSLSKNNNCTDDGNNIDIFIPTLLLTVPCGLSSLCLLSLKVHTLSKPLIRKK